MENKLSTALPTEIVENPSINEEIFIDEMPIIVEDTIEGTSKNDALVGDLNSDGISGLGGDDVIIGFESLDVLSGGEGKDLIFGGEGDDRLLGDRGNDFLSGDRGQDNIRGGKGRDLLAGGADRDFLRGDEGRDILIGGEGSDVFILQPERGTDTIVDFEDGTDRLGLLFGTDFDNLEISQIGENTAITINSDRIAVLVGIDANLITASDFGRVIFAL